MNIIRFTAVLLLILALSGCASSGGTTKNANPEPSLNDKYVHAINESNRSRVSSVHWIYYPSDEEVARRLNKRSDNQDDSDADSDTD